MVWNGQAGWGSSQERIGGCETLEEARLRALTSLAHQSVLPLDLAGVQGLALRTSVELTAADAGCLHVLDPMDDLVLSLSVRVDPEYLAAYPRLSMDHGVAQAVLGRSGPVSLPADTLDDAIKGLLGTRPVEQVVLVPLLSQHGAQGFLILAYAAPRELRAEEQEWLRVVGTLTGSAMVNSRAYEEAEKRSRTDALTGLASRSYFEELFRRELARARRAGGVLSLAMVDIDDFKEINDRFGHVTGDQVLAAVGRLLKEVRATDVVARYGGDEFVILLPDTTAEEAQAVTTRIRQRLSEVNQEGQFPFPLRVSIGVRQTTSLDADILAEADAAMYADKRGRIAPSPKPRVSEGELDGRDEVWEEQSRSSAP